MMTFMVTTIYVNVVFLECTNSRVIIVKEKRKIVVK